ncbi:MAG: glycosyltransferase [Muribaculaceae bacterium]|nr:glycosyltransferase [Muribaculaceae bacterium]MBR5684831.1 glycosyltransferase [Muribaculaceae bacterium]
MEPLFSIITVTWNAASVIMPTLESVRRQTSSDYEMLIIDGASSDDTLAIVKRASIAALRVFSEPDKGLYDAMNKGLARARGRYLVFLNAGDTFADDAVLARLARLATDNPGVIYGQTQLVDEQRNVVGKRHLTAPKRLTADSFLNGMVVCHQAFVVRRDLAPEYDLQYRLSADYDWCIRVLQKSPANAYAGSAPIISYLADGMTTRHHRASLWERYRIMCRHYGTMRATLRHFGFLPRYLKRRLSGSANRQ